ncbi:MAG: NADH:flavin oxidoreductase/NADH oxidase [Culicoidibacterales bacterium]
MLFEKITIKNLEAKNRIVVPPMCTYHAENGEINSFHQMHYGSMVLGQPGLIIVEATGVSPEGRITEQDLGLYNDCQAEKMKAFVEEIKRYHNLPLAIQLNHAGRKSTTKDPIKYAPSSIRFDESLRTPTELTIQQIQHIIAAFAQSAKYAHEAGFDALEIHAAHGYLIHQFLSPLTNQRKDEYGGTYRSRIRFLREVIAAVKSEWPSGKVLMLRISADDYHADGNQLADYREMMLAVAKEIDILDVSTGGIIPVQPHVYPGYQLKHAQNLREATKLPVIAAGLLQEYDLAQYALESGQSDFIAMGRAMLTNPHLPIALARKSGQRIPQNLPYNKGI